MRREDTLRTLQRLKDEPNDGIDELTPSEIHRIAVSMLLWCIDDPRITAAFEALEQIT
jgi:hypothetical protein